MREATFKRRLIAQAEIRPGQHVLDLGCGTGTLTILLKQAHPGADVRGLDADPVALELARRKAVESGVELRLDRGMSSVLPYAEHAFDRVVSSLLFHHLTRADKEATLREVRRVLRPGGELHVADFGRARNPVMRVAFLLVQMLDGFEITSDNVRGALPGLFARAGFEDVRQRGDYQTICGTLSLYQARKPR
ncbi:MAG: class I SAM-dependent methyltransferase [Candidatus Rokubacteria bacterium]|nr:class I SAM-dependent methyltransferase [Candidatus Rokubacteria bacterium]